MSRLGQRLRTRWEQFTIETALLICGVQGLVANLACVRTLGLQNPLRLEVVVDSLREAMTLRLLRLAGVIPACAIHTVDGPGELRGLVQGRTPDSALLVVTPHLYSRHYQVLAAARRKLQLVVL